MADRARVVYRVTIRYRGTVQQYGVFEVEAADLRDALAAAAERFGDELAESADLIEIMVAHRVD